MKAQTIKSNAFGVATELKSAIVKAIKFFAVALPFYGAYTLGVPQLSGTEVLAIGLLVLGVYNFFWAVR